MELSSTTRRLLEVEAARFRAATRQEAVYGIAAATIASLYFLVLLDCVAVLPAWLRAAITLTGFTAFFVQLKKRLAVSGREDASAPKPELVAALLDQERPDAEGSLLAAVQLAKSPVAARGTSRRLVELALQRAHVVASEMLGTERPANAPPRIQRIVLSACAATLLLCLAFPRVVRFELPRLLLPWQDNPPFSLTDFLVTPGDIVVKAGAEVTVEARIGGKQPEAVDLVTEMSDGRVAAAALIPAEGTVYRQRLQGVRESLVYYFRAETGRSRRYTIRVHDPPEVRGARLIIRSRPGGKPVRTLGVGREPISVPRSAFLELEIEASRAVRHGSLRLTEASGASRRVPLSVDRLLPERATAQFTLEHDAELQVALRAKDGSANGSALTGRVRVLPGSPPSVFIIEPGGNLLVAPGTRVRLRAAAEDDLGVTELHLVTSRNGAARPPISRIFAEPGPRGEISHVLDLKADSAKAGDVYEIEATARSAAPSGPREAHTPRSWIWVVSSNDLARLRSNLTRSPNPIGAWPEAAEQTVRLAKEQARLAARAEVSAGSGSVADLVSVQRGLLERGRQVAGQYSKIANARALDSVERLLKQRAGQLAQQLRSVIGGSMQVAAQAQDGTTRKEAMGTAAENLARIAAGAQDALAAIQALQRAAAMSLALERMEAVTAQQRLIASRAKRANRGMDQAAAEQPKALETAQQANRRELDEALALLRGAARSFADEAEPAERARTMLDAAANSQPGEPMGRAAAALRGGRMAQAEDAAAEAARRLEALTAVCRQCAQAGLRVAAARASARLGRLVERDILQALRSLGGPSGDGAPGFQGMPKPGSRPGASMPKIGANGQSIRIGGTAADGETSLGAGIAPNVRSEIGADAVEVLPGAHNGAQSFPNFDKDSAYGRYRDLVNAYFRSLAGISREKQ